MISKEQYSNLSCFEEFDIRCTMYGHDPADVLKQLCLKVESETNAYCILPTGEGLIWFHEGKRTAPPDVWTGTFDISGGILTKLPVVSLHGCPKKIYGDFDCSCQKLVSLVGGPQEVHGNYNCNFNDLHSLLGAPAQISGNFACDWNKLTSLAGAPAIVGGSFFCQYNNLSSFDGMPSEIGKDLFVENSGFPSIMSKQAESEARKLSKINGHVYYLPKRIII